MKEFFTAFLREYPSLVFGPLVSLITFLILWILIGFIRNPDKTFPHKKSRY